MKILFISPPWSDVYGNYRHAAKVGNNYPPLGLCYLASVLERGGHQVKIIDAEADNQTIDDLIEQVRVFSPKAVGFTSTTPVYHIVQKIAERIKQNFPTLSIFLGGPHSTIVLNKILE